MAQYANMTLPDVCDLLLDDYLLLLRDAFIARKLQSADGREYLDNAWRLEQTEPDVDGLIFYRPTRGLLSSNFNPDERHFGVDIAANPNESVLATLDGTVVFGGYTAETGYVIEIQHNRDFISVYKHCGSLLKQTGDKVKAGEVIALVGNTGAQTTGPHLHFELWRKGEALNPEKYIVF